MYECIDLQKCGRLTHMAGNASIALNYPVGICQGFAPYVLLSNKKKHEISPGTTVAGVALPTIRTTGLNLNMLNYLSQAAFPELGASPIVNPSVVPNLAGLGTFRFSKGAWVLTLPNGVELTITNPRRELLFDACERLVAVTVRSTMIQTYQDINCRQHIYDIDKYTVAWGTTTNQANNPAPFTTPATALAAAAVAAAPLDAGSPTINPTTPEAACSALTTTILNAWRATNVPNLANPGLTITDDIVLAPGG
jgi:hypothetical protein